VLGLVTDSFGIARALATGASLAAVGLLFAWRAPDLPDGHST
jgi:hypothetical protein